MSASHDPSENLAALFGVCCVGHRRSPNSGKPLPITETGVSALALAVLVIGGALVPSGYCLGRQGCQGLPYLILIVLIRGASLVNTKSINSPN
jgi:hypothetical protein